MSHLHPCLWPGACGQPLLCCALCCRCVCFQGCQTSWAFCREEWRPRSLASFHAGGPLLDGSWTSIWESADTNQTPHYNLLSCACNVFILSPRHQRGLSNQHYPLLKHYVWLDQSTTTTSTCTSHLTFQELICRSNLHSGANYLPLESSRFLSGVTLQNSHNGNASMSI